MSKIPSPKRQITCEVCGRLCRTKHKERDIRYTCYKKEPCTPCIRCGNKKHLVSQETGLCPHCADRPEAICARCSQLKVIHNTQAQLCKKCNAYVRNDHRAEGMLIIKIECAVCGKMRISQLSERDICRACHKEELNGRRPCSKCMKVKVIYDKPRLLCLDCHRDAVAPQSLRTYLTTFTSPYPYNIALFELLTAKIDWSSIDRFKARQIREFGRFLQIYRFREPLTWEAIDEALPSQ